MKRVNLYNIVVGGILLLVIYSITMNIVRLHWQEEQFLEIYKEEQQAKNDLLTLKVENYIKREDTRVDNLDELIGVMKEFDTSTAEVWKYDLK